MESPAEPENQLFDKEFSNKESIMINGPFEGVVNIVDIKPNNQKPIVLFTGWGGNEEVYKNSLQAIHDRTGRRVLGVSYEGAKGDKQSERFPAIEIVKAEAMLSILEKKGIDKVDIIGHSAGALSAVIAASEKPEAIGDIVLVDPSGIIGPDTFPKMLGRFSMKMIRQSVRFAKEPEDRSQIKRFFMEGTKYAVKHPVQGMLEAVDISQSEILDVLEELKTEGHGISIISGVDDPLFPMERMQQQVHQKHIDGFYAVEGGHDEVHFNPDYMVAAVKALDDLDKSK